MSTNHQDFSPPLRTEKLQKMKLGLLTCISLFSSRVLAKDVPQLDIDFFSVLLDDFRSQGTEYVGYVATASGVDVPSEMTSLILNGGMFTDDSFTTWLTRDDVNVDNLRAVATQLPWYSRIETRLATTTMQSSSTETMTSSSGTTGMASSSGTTGMMSSSGTISMMSSSGTTGSTSSGMSSSTRTMSAGGVANYAPQALFGIAALFLFSGI